MDPERLRRRKLLDEERRRVQAAAGLAPAEGGREIAQAVRAVLREFPGAVSPELDAVLEACDALGYAPEGAAQTLDEELVPRALEALSAVGEESR